MAEEDEANELDRWTVGPAYRGHCDRRGQVDRIAVDACRDRRERDARAAELRCHFDRPPVAGCEQLGLSGFPSSPDRTDGVDHLPGRQPACSGRLGVAGGAAAQQAALGEDLRPARAVNRTVDAATAEQARVCRVDDCVDYLLGDVAAYSLDHRGRTLALSGKQPRRRGAAELDEDAGDDRIELAPRAAMDLGQGLARGQRRPIRPR